MSRVVILWVIVAVSAVLAGAVPIVVDVRSGFNYLSRGVACTRIMASALLFAVAVLCAGLALVPDEPFIALVGASVILVLQVVAQLGFVHRKRVQLVQAWHEGRELPSGVSAHDVAAWAQAHNR